MMNRMAMIARMTAPATRPVDRPPDSLIKFTFLPEFVLVPYREAHISWDHESGQSRLLAGR
jgi:hypothetical protein